MSSSSSSDCECEDSCHYATGFYENYGNTVNRTPYYPTMGHPLIYYTQTSPYYKPQPVKKRHSRKRDPNCFVKAFRWYTQERTVCNKNESHPQTNGNEFASWLDMKYDEYIGNKLDQQSSYKLTLKQTSVIKAEKTYQNVCADTCTNNFKTKFKRLKSPWSKKRPARCYKESGDIDKGNHSCNSCQYILQPKDLTRLNSECCQSSVITIPTDSPKRSAAKSQSLINLSQAKRERSQNEPVEVIPTQEGTQLIKDSIFRKESSINKKTISRTKSGLVDVSCQCTIGNVNKVDAETQYEDVTVEIARSSQHFLKQASSSQTLKAASQTTSPLKTRTVFCECGHNEVICECVYQEPETMRSAGDAATQYEPQVDERFYDEALYETIQVPKPPPRKCPCEMEPDEFIVPVAIASLKQSHMGAQTSDRSITFEKDSPYNYPLFMKIICADKLIEENSK